MVTSKECTKKYPKGAKIIDLTTSSSYLDKDKTSVLETVQRGGVKITQTRTNTKGRDTNKSYVEGLAKI